MRGKKLAAFLAAGSALIGVPMAWAGLGIQIPGTNWAVSSDDSGATENGEDPVPQCSVNGYRLSLSNVDHAGATIKQYTDKMEPGFTYVPGSSSLTDVNTSTTTPFPDPAISGATGNVLTWKNLSIPVPTGDTTYLHFNVVVLDRSDPNVKNPNALSYDNHGIVILTDGGKANQSTKIRVAKVLSDC
jgi:hypothetical protein